ncbi:unnamed protein product [Caenorhabditis sp. 36 PRJEB53466]|nr:unnamed protein product [Caenorhabditis sp. 36 PRJEB53466]
MTGNLPSLRLLFVSFSCLIFAEFVLFAVWQLSLQDVFHSIVLRFNFERYRIALTFIPLICIIGLMILNSHFFKVTKMTHSGLGTLDTKDDSSFMPIKERIQKTLNSVKCEFGKHLLRKLDQVQIEKFLNAFMQETVNGTVYGSVYNNFTGHIQNHSSKSEQCEQLKREMASAVREKEENWEIGDEIRKLGEEYVRMTQGQMTVSFAALGKALGTIEEFVEKYHTDVLQLPLQTDIDAFYNSVVGISVASAAISGVFSFLLITSVVLRRKWMIIIANISIFLVICFSAILISCFLLIISWISFIQLTQDACLSFQLFGTAKPSVITESGFTNTINYGVLLRKSYDYHGTYFSRIKDDLRRDRYDIPIALDGKRLWKPSALYNETLRNVTEYAEQYDSNAANECRNLKQLYENVRNLSVRIGCQEKEFVETILKKFESKTNESCRESAEAAIRKHPSVDEIRSKSFDFWKRTLIPKRSYGVISKKRLERGRGLFQVYLVFMNPARKLRPDVLEPLFGMALLMLAMAPIHFFMAIYLMSILPLLTTKKDVSQRSQYQNLSTEDTTSNESGSES